MNTQSTYSPRLFPLSLGSSRALQAALCVAGVSLGCNSEAVDLGGGTLTRDLARAGACAESTELRRDVLISNQAELDALAGCEHILGSLTVRIFEGADLTPLHALRAVDAELALGLPQRWDALIGFGTSDRLDNEVPLLQAGWLKSLDGVQALEHVGALFLRGLPDADLTAFENLKTIGGDLGPFSRGALILQQNYKLRDLSGLENFVGVDQLVVTLNPLLESLTGLRVGGQLGSVSIYESPQLTDLAALSSVTQLDNLILYRTALADLSGLAALAGVQNLSIFDNAALVDASGLTSLSRADQFSVTSNPRLERLPSFEPFAAQPDILIIRQNPELEQLTLDFQNAGPKTYNVEGFPEQPDEFVGFELGIGVIDIRENASLQQLSIRSGLQVAQLVLIAENNALGAIDFGSLRQVNQLTIHQNPNLTRVEIGALQTANLLELTDNPQLSSRLFDGVQSFTRQISGDAD